MVNRLARHFSDRAKEMRASEVRELLKLLQVPDMISFAGGFRTPTRSRSTSSARSPTRS